MLVKSLYFTGFSDKVLWLSDTWPLAGHTGFWNGTYYWKPARRKKTEIKQKIWNKKKKKKGLIPKSLILGWNISSTLEDFFPHRTYLCSVKPASLLNGSLLQTFLPSGLLFYRRGKTLSFSIPLCYLQGFWRDSNNTSLERTHNSKFYL